MKQFDELSIETKTRHNPTAVSFQQKKVYI